MFTKMLLLLSEVRLFLKSPYDNLTLNELNHKKKFQYLFRLGLLSLALSFAVVIAVVIEKFILSRYGIEIKSKDLNFGIYTIFIIALLGPFLEELIFRLPLSFRKRDVNIWLFTLLGLAVFYIVSLYKGIDPSRNETTFIKYIFLIAGAGIVYLFNTITEESFEKMKKMFGKHILWGSIIIFTLGHLSSIANFDIRLLPIYLFNLFPIFFLAIILSFCRLQFGFFYSFAFHTAWNLLFFLRYI
jgi:hypothetical protein